MIKTCTSSQEKNNFDKLKHFSPQQKNTMRIQFFNNTIKFFQDINFLRAGRRTKTDKISFPLFFDPRPDFLVL